MSERYMPTTEAVREKWAFEEGDPPASRAEFDAWLAGEGELMSAYVPTTEQIRTEWALSNPGGSPSTIMHAEAAFDRWLAEHDRQVVVCDRCAFAEGRESMQGEHEQEGKRWFTPAYRSTSGNIIAFGSETVVQEHAQRYADEFTREDPEGPDYFVATRILPPWLPVEQGGAS